MAGWKETAKSVLMPNHRLPDRLPNHSTNQTSRTRGFNSFDQSANDFQDAKSGKSAKSETKTVKTEFAFFSSSDENPSDEDIGEGTVRIFFHLCMFCMIHA